MVAKNKNIVQVGEVKTSERVTLSPRRLVKKVPKPVAIIIVVAIILIIGFVVYLFVKPDQSKKAEEQAQAEKTAKTTFEDFEARKKAQSEAPSAQKQYQDLQKKVADLPNPNDSKESLEWYIQAAVAGAKLQSPESKAYAAKALELYPTDPNIRAQNAGEITRLEAIAKGDYAAAN